MFARATIPGCDAAGSLGVRRRCAWIRKESLYGEAFVRVYLQVKTGDLEVLLAGHDFAVLEAIDRAIRSEDDKVELWFHVPDLAGRRRRGLP